MVPPPPAVPEELWEEILLRLPPDDPASLLRTSLVSKQWRLIITRRGFRRRLGELHGAAPMLGFFRNTGDSLAPRFIPTTALSFPVPERRTWTRFLNCRHGRVLAVSTGAAGCAQDLLVWEPITGYQRRVPVPAAANTCLFNAAVICAAGDCNHWDCQGGPFRVIFVFSSNFFLPVTSAWEYSSETGAWSEPIRASIPSYVISYGSILVGKSLYFPCNTEEILEYDLGKQCLALIHRADAFLAGEWGNILVEAEDGGLGVARINDSRLYLWSRHKSGHGDSDAGWVLRRTIHLAGVVLAAALSGTPFICFVKGANLIFLSTTDGVFTIELSSGRCRNVWGGDSGSPLFPFFSFYAPGIQAGAGEQGLETK